MMMNIFWIIVAGVLAVLGTVAICRWSTLLVVVLLCAGCTSEPEPAFDKDAFWADRMPPDPRPQSTEHSVLVDEANAHFRAVNAWWNRLTDEQKACVVGRWWFEDRGADCKCEQPPAQPEIRLDDQPSFDERQAAMKQAGGEAPLWKGE